MSLQQYQNESDHGGPELTVGSTVFELVIPL